MFSFLFCIFSIICQSLSLPDSQSTDFGSCVCDLTGSSVDTVQICDPGCRCDPDCSPSEIDLFTTTLPETNSIPGLNVDICVSDSVLTKVSSKIETTVLEGEICVQQDNNPSLGTFYSERGLLEDNPEFSANDISSHDFEGSVNPQYLFEPSDSFSNNIYQSGDNIMSGSASSSGGTVAFTIPFPSRTSNGECIDSNPALFLQDIDPEPCFRNVRTISSFSQLCQGSGSPLAALTYRSLTVSIPSSDGANLAVVCRLGTAGPINLPPTSLPPTSLSPTTSVPPTYPSSTTSTSNTTTSQGPTSTTTTSTSTPTATITSSSISSSDTNARKKRQTQTQTTQTPPTTSVQIPVQSNCPSTFWDASSQQCMNMVTAAQYIFSHDSRGHLSSTQVILEVSDVPFSSIQPQGGLFQHFGVTFLPSSAQSDVEVLEQRSGNPGYVNGLPIIAAHSTPNSTVGDPMSRLSSGIPLLGNSISGCVPGGGDILTFGEDRMTGCAITISQNMDCSQIAATTSAILNPTYSTTSGKLFTHVGIYGNPTSSNSEDWLPVIYTPPSESSGFSCDSIITAIKYRFLISDSGRSDNPQKMILGVKVSFEESEISTKFSTCCHSPSSQFPLELRSVVTFVTLKEEDLVEQLPTAPPVLPTLPSDIFYPFSLLSSAWFAPNCFLFTFTLIYTFF